MPTAVILVGLPATGKSTYREETVGDCWAVLSTDDNVMTLAESQGYASYDEAWPHVVKQADQLFFLQLKLAVDGGKDVMIDRTNMSVKTRARLIEIIRGSKQKYHLVAIVFGRQLDVHEWLRRMGSRPGKTIPIKTLIQMAENFQTPTVEEGFDKVIEIN